jgi:hypothetical protein
MNKKAVSGLSIVRGAAQWQESPWQTEMALLRMRPYVRLAEPFKQAFKTTHLVYPMDC